MYIVLSIVFVLVLVFIGLWVSKFALHSAEGFFLGHRKFSWWVVGMSMSSAVYSIDFALTIVGHNALRGVSSNWIWQSMLVGSLFFTFFLARFWRKMHVITDLEIIETRYGGKPAKYLRRVKAVYFGLFVIGFSCILMNTILQKILFLFFNSEEAHFLFLFVALAVIVYTGMVGQVGVVVLGVIVFVVVFVFSVVISILMLNHTDIVGMGGLQKSVPEWMFSMLPKIVEHDIESQFGVFELTSVGFFFTLFIQWWSIAAFGVENVNSPMLIQKVMSAKNEKHSMWAMLLFTLIHYCMRPWVWIILGLISVSFYPNLVAEGNTVYAILRLDQPIFRVLLLIMFLGMYMSNMSSQFNLAASYLFNDLINPIWKERIYRGANLDQQFTSAPIFIAPILVVIVGLFSLWLSVGNMKYLIIFWNFSLQIGAGAGFVLVARWFWWRINIWTEWACFISPVLGILFSYLFEIDFQRSFFVITLSTIFISVAITYLTNPEGINVLESFCEKAQMGGLLWKKKSFSISTYSHRQEFIFWVIDWLLGVISFYSLMFAIGRAIFSQYLSSIVLTLVSLTSIMLLFIDLDRRGWMKSRNKI